MMDDRRDSDFIYNGPRDIHLSCQIGVGTRAPFCNMVDGQPLFYMDDSADSYDVIEDDIFLHDLELIESLRDKAYLYDRAVRSLYANASLPDGDDFSAIFHSDEPETALSVDNILNTGQNSRSFAALHRALADKGIAFQADAGVPQAEYDRAGRTIRFNPAMQPVAAIRALIAPMRTAWHHMNGALINPLCFQPEDGVLVNRLLAADAAVAGLEIAWELRLAGNEAMWSAMMMGGESDLCMAYGVAAMTDFRNLKNGAAARAAFEKWFISSRCTLRDRDLIRVMLAHHGEPLFDGDAMSRTVAADVIARIGERPVGKNYLSPLVGTIMSDGLFGDVRDRSNANFLWFIRFEKSMRETERELQMDGKTSQRPFGQTNHDHAATIIPFNPERVPAAVGKRFASQRGDGADLFYLDHFRVL